MESAVADALSSGVAWNNLGPLKTKARKLTWNKSSWSRAVREVSPAAAGEVQADAAAGEADEPVAALQLNEKCMSSNDVLGRDSVRILALGVGSNTFFSTIKPPTP